MREMCDTLWAKAIDADWDYRCAVCGSQNIQAHHLTPRQFEATRYELINGVALCYHHHQSDKNLSPHKNAAGWMAWLNHHHPMRAEWYIENRRPQWYGTKNPDYFCNTIRRLKQYVDPIDYVIIVGQQFSEWLDEQEEKASE
jgi:hypothetical protein